MNLSAINAYSNAGGMSYHVSVRDSRCLTCNQTGKIKITHFNPIALKLYFKNDSNNLKYNYYQNYFIKCPDCNGTGFTDTKNKTDQLNRINIFCKCNVFDKSIKAKDGKIVFGHDVDICTNCGLVTNMY